MSMFKTYCRKIKKVLKSVEQSLYCYSVSIGKLSGILSTEILICLRNGKWKKEKVVIKLVDFQILQIKLAAYEEALLRQSTSLEKIHKRMATQALITNSTPTLQSLLYYPSKVPRASLRSLCASFLLLDKGRKKK
jgi:hypothetical protein